MVRVNDVCGIEGHSYIMLAKSTHGNRITPEIPGSNNVVVGSELTFQYGMYSG